MFPLPLHVSSVSTVILLFLGLSSSSFLQTQRQRPKRCLSVSSDLLPCLLWIIQRVNGKLQPGLDMWGGPGGPGSHAGSHTVAKGNFWGPDLCQVSSSIDYCSSGLILTILMINDSPQGEIGNRAPIWGSLLVSSSLFHFIPQQMLSYQAACL